MDMKTENWSGNLIVQWRRATCRHDPLNPCGIMKRSLFRRGMRMWLSIEITEVAARFIQQ